MPIYFPPLPGTANDGDTMIAAQTFAKRGELNPLALPSVQEFLGLGSTGTAADDENAILASQVFGP